MLVEFYKSTKYPHHIPEGIIPNDIWIPLDDSQLKEDIFTRWSPRWLEEVKNTKLVFIDIDYNIQTFSFRREDNLDILNFNSGTGPKTIETIHGPNMSGPFIIYRIVEEHIPRLPRLDYIDD